MLYRRSQEIERHLRDVIDLIRSGPPSTHSLAPALATSQPTVSRCLTVLRARGYTIRSVQGDSGWSYEIVGEPARVAQGSEAVP